MSEDEEATRTAVRTYVPSYQKQRWAEEADELEMSQSEFVRTMVQAGRRSFELDESPDTDPEGRANESIASDDGELADRVLGILHERDDPQTWDDLVAAVTNDVEDRLDGALGTLQEAGKLRYSGRDGGYVPTDDA
ncbi:DUF5805 domain-containing protein [Haloarchaeobius iranensis]|uniref:Uncharacterized protein n=1 Tax=Haloarchaeobius iranensis TaxID=996166 RepID=A0A1G9TQQ3_9EURY|nr:DUF5805 domain-containing protein [Haloarchaeobius iranensis]SDM50106.1 hypothetical protein SAMN05192554_10375 [Haloarchaeobius iranensis]